MIVDINSRGEKLYFPIMNMGGFVGNLTFELTYTLTGENKRFFTYVNDVNDRYLRVNVLGLNNVGIYVVKIFNGSNELYRGKIRVIDTAKTEALITPELSSENKKIIFYDGK